MNEEWKDDDKRHFFVPLVGATDHFRYGMSLNPHLKAFIMHGRFDSHPDLRDRRGCGT